MAEDKKVVVKPNKEKEKKPEVRGATLGDLLALKGQTLKAKK